MSAEQSSVHKAFEEFLRTRRDHREGLSARQQLWTAFVAGGDWVLSELRPLTIQEIAVITKEMAP